MSRRSSFCALSALCLSFTLLACGDAPEGSEPGAAGPAPAASGTTTPPKPAEAKPAKPAMDLSKVNEKNRQMYLLKAAGAGDLEAVEKLIGMGADPTSADRWSGHPVDAAVRGGNVEILRLFLKKGAKSPTALLSAVLNGRTEMARILIENGADVNVTGVYEKIADRATPLEMALIEGNEEIAALLEKAGAKRPPLDEEATRAFFRGAGKIPHMTRFLVRGGKIDAKDGRRDSILHGAAARGDVESLTWILGKGLPVDTSGSYGRTAIFSAAKANRIDNIRFLVAKGAKIDGQDEDGDTPLAASAGDMGVQLPTIEALLELGAKLDVANKRGHTPLHRAAKSGYAKAAGFLAGKGAKLDVKDAAGKTPLDLAFNQQTKDAMLAAAKR